MNAPVQRLVSIAILIGWLVPSATALGVGMHLASEHHGPHGLEHQQEIADLVRAAAHGHHHDLGTAPDHRHEARIDGQPPSSRPDLDEVASLPAIAAPDVAFSPEEIPEEMLRRAPPRPLFEVNCVLLI